MQGIWCFWFTENFRSVFQTVVTSLFLFLCLQALLREVVRQNITDKQWIASEAWVTFTSLSVPENLPSLVGTIGFALRRAPIPGLGAFLAQLRPGGPSPHHDPFLRELWEELFGCSLEAGQGTARCSGSEVIGQCSCYRKTVLFITMKVSIDSLCIIFM